MPSTITDRIDGVSTSTALKSSCYVATTTNITLSGVQTIDTISVPAGKRVLVKDQTNKAENGIYNSSATAWERAADFNGARDVVCGTAVLIINGSVNLNKEYRISTADPITIGTTEIEFSLFQEVTDTSDFTYTSSAATLNAGTLTLAYSRKLFIPVTLNQNVTTLTLTGLPSSPTVWRIWLQLIQDGTGGRTLTWPSGWYGVAGQTLPLSAGAGDEDQFMIWGYGSKVYVASMGQYFRAFP
jgi:hypothetical protein